MPATLTTAFAVAVTCALAILPGLAVLAVCQAAPRGGIERLGLAAGIGLAFVPVLDLWADRLGVGISGVAWWVVLNASTIVLLVAMDTRRSPRRGTACRAPTIGHATADGGSSAASLATADGGSSAAGMTTADGGSSAEGAPGVDGHLGSAVAAPAAFALVLVLAVQLAARWYAARAVAIPIWADSVHHAIIARLFQLHHGLPHDWQPLAPLATFSYHFGFHAVTAAVADLTGLPVPRAMIIVGQTLMVLQALTAAGLATGLTGRRWAGVAAAVVVGGLGPMPGTYLTWGRYTQLAGQVVLPAAILATVLAARGPVRPDDEDDSVRRLIGRLLVAAVVVAGLALTHYVVTAFFVAAIGAWWLVDGGDGLKARAASLGRLAVVAAFAFTLALPWLPRFLAGNLDRNAAALVSTELPGAVWGAVSLAYVLDHFGQWVGVALTAATLAAIAIGLVRRDRIVALATVWMAGLVAASYPQGFGLPITGPLKDFTVLIGLYVPASLAIGAAVASVIAQPPSIALSQHWGRDRSAKPTREGALGGATPAALSALAVALAALLGWRQRDVIQPDHVIATPADAAALAWVKANTPPDAVFLASGTPTYGDTVVLGDDGGWWLPVLAGRACTIPPLPIGHERTVEPDYRERTVALAKAVAADLGAPGTIALLKREGVGWAYVGPTAKALTAAKLEAAGGWRKVYDVDGASVWAADWGGPHPVPALTLAGFAGLSLSHVVGEGPVGEPPFAAKGW